ncbi:RNaseH domain-containing protein [Saccharopolyspora sp. 5N102]|uniref:RNaseH domain-containing protein n=1 Tax=Saccharopolyspora sp. 5N102 TaxID=3375155 RepID=UPI0037B0EF54
MHTDSDTVQSRRITRLAKLVTENPTDAPIILFVDALSARTIRPGLQNTRYANDTLPGDTLRAAGKDVAIIRCNASAEIGRPVTRQDESRSPADPLQPGAKSYRDQRADRRSADGRQRTSRRFVGRGILPQRIERGMGRLRDGSTPRGPGT